MPLRLKNLNFSPGTLWGRLLRLAYARGYRLGLAAGRRSFRLHVHHCKPGEPVSLLVSNAELPALISPYGSMHLRVDDVSLLIQDTMPQAETYPDQDD